MSNDSGTFSRCPECGENVYVVGHGAACVIGGLKNKLVRVRAELAAAKAEAREAKQMFGAALLRLQQLGDTTFTFPASKPTERPTEQLPEKVSKDFTDMEELIKDLNDPLEDELTEFAAAQTDLVVNGTGARCEQTAVSSPSAPSADTDKHPDCVAEGCLNKIHHGYLCRSTCEKLEES